MSLDPINCKLITFLFANYCFAKNDRWFQCLWEEKAKINVSKSKLNNGFGEKSEILQSHTEWALRASSVK